MKHPIDNTRYGIGNTYIWLTEAFTNWDTEAYDMRDQAIYMFYKITEFFYKVIEFFSMAIRAIREIVDEFLNSMRMWK